MVDRIPHFLKEDLKPQRRNVKLLFEKCGAIFKMALTRFQKKKLDGIFAQKIHTIDDEFLCSLVGKIIRDGDRSNLSILEEIRDRNPEKKRKYIVNPRRVLCGSMYFLDCFSLAEIGLELFAKGPDSLVEMYRRSKRKESIKRGQILYCVSCLRNRRFLDFFKDSATENSCLYSLDNALYAIGYMEARQEYKFVMEFLASRTVVGSAVWILNHWTTTRNHAESLAAFKPRAKGRDSRQFIDRILANHGFMDGPKEEDFILDDPLPPGRPSPDVLTPQIS